MTQMQHFVTETEAEVIGKLREALDALLQRDRHVLGPEATERTISCRLAMHLQRLFDDWDVDCEYNCWAEEDIRKGHLVVTTSTTATEARTIYPDILIHRRGLNERLVVIELNTSAYPQGRHQDLKKLRRCKSLIDCHHGLLLEIGVGDDLGHHRIEAIA